MIEPSIAPRDMDASLSMVAPHGDSTHTTAAEVLNTASELAGTKETPVEGGPIVINLSNVVTIQSTDPEADNSDNDNTGRRSMSSTEKTAIAVALMVLLLIIGGSTGGTLYAAKRPTTRGIGMYMYMIHQVTNYNARYICSYLVHLACSSM